MRSWLPEAPNAKSKSQNSDMRAKVDILKGHWREGHGLSPSDVTFGIAR